MNHLALFMNNPNFAIPKGFLGEEQMMLGMYKDVKTCKLIHSVVLLLC